MTERSEVDRLGLTARCARCGSGRVSFVENPAGHPPVAIPLFPGWHTPVCAFTRWDCPACGCRTVACPCDLCAPRAGSMAGVDPHAAVELGGDVPPIPDRVVAMPFHRPYGNMATTGMKGIETRGRAFDRDPCWIAVVNAARVATLSPEARRQPHADRFFGSRDPDVVGAPGTCPGLIYVARSRPLSIDDLPRSFFFEAGRYAWIVECAVHLREPVPIAELGLKRVPQGYAWVSGVRLREAVRATWAAEGVRQVLGA